MHTGDTIHLLHVVPEPSMIHVWPGMYVPPDDDAEKEEVQHLTSETSFCTHAFGNLHIPNQLEVIS